MNDKRNDLPPLRAGGVWSGDEKADPDAAKKAPGKDKPLRDWSAPVKDAKAAEEGTKEHHREFVGTGLFWGLVVGVLLSVVVIVFSAQNTGDATINFLPWEWSSPLFVVILVSLIMGIVLDEIAGLVYRSRRRRALTEREELKRLRGKP